MSIPQHEARYETFRRYYQRLTPILKTPQNRAYTAAIFSFLTAALFGWYAIRPTIQTILVLKREVKDKIAVNQKMEEKITNLIEAQAAYDAVSDKVATLSEALPETPEAVELARQLREAGLLSAASISAIQIQTVPINEEATPSGETGMKKAGEFLITFTTSSTFPAVREVLDTILSLRRIVTIDTLTITQERGGPDGGIGLLQMTLKLMGYYGK